MTILEEIKGFGFLNGKIKFGDYTYNVNLITNRQYEQYKQLLKDKKYVDGLNYILSVCLYREEERKNIFQKIFKLKGTITKVYDFDMQNYPVVMTKKFTEDLFMILLDQNFFDSLVESEVK